MKFLALRTTSWRGIKKNRGMNTMDVFTAISERRSVRAYKNVDIEEDKLKKILEAARQSPSAKNRQLWKFIVVKDARTREKLVEAANGQAFIGEAPVVIVACGTETDYIMSCGQHAYTIDVSIACAYMILEACELGLGSCWLGSFKEAEVKRILNIPESVRVVTMIPFGYPVEPGAKKHRKDMVDIVSYEK